MSTKKGYFLRNFILLIIIALFTSGVAHKFYVSLTEIIFRPEKGTIEISMRIFPDDLDKTLQKINGKNPQLSTELELKEADEWVDDYLHAHFKIFVNKEEIKYKYIGKEPESDAIWCYMEAEFSSKPESIKVTNSVLTDVFRDQKNIIQVYYLDSNKGLLLDAYHTTDSLEVKKP